MKEWVIVHYDIPSPDTWKTQFNLIYNIPFDSKVWEKLKELDEQHFGTKHIKEEEKSIKQYEKETKKKALDQKGDYEADYILWKKNKEAEEEKKLRDQYEKKTKRKVLTKKGYISKDYLKWKDIKVAKKKTHFWDYFISTEKYDELPTSIKNEMVNLLFTGDINNFVLRINKIEVDDPITLRKRYEMLFRPKKALSQSGNETKSYITWRKDNLEKPKFIKHLRHQTGISPKPLTPRDVDLWGELSKEQKLHNKIVEFNKKTDPSLITKHNQLISQNKAGVPEISKNFKGIFKKRKITNGLPSILKNYPKMKGIKFIPDGRLLRLRWSVSKPLFTKKDLLLNPKYLKALYSGSIKTIEDKERWEHRKYIPVGSAFSSTRGVLNTRLKGAGHTPTKKSDYIVNVDNCFAPNFKNPSDPNDPNFDPDYSPDEIVYNPDLPHSIYSWIAPTIDPKTDEIDKNTGGFSTNSPRSLRDKNATSFQEIFFAELMPLYVLIRNYMTSYRDEELFEIFEDTFPNKKALDQNNLPTSEYASWRSSFLKSSKGKLKSIYQYGYGRLIGIDEGFDDWITYLIVRVPNQRALIHTVKTIGDSIWKNDPNFLKKIETDLVKKYKEYIDQDETQHRGHLKNFIINKKESYLRTIRTYPFTEKISNNSLDRYIEKYNEFIIVYNRKNKTLEPIIEGITKDDKRNVAIELLKSYDWYYTIPNSHFIPDENFQEKLQIKERRIKIEHCLYYIEKKFNEEESMPQFMKKTKFTKKELVQLHKDGYDDSLVDYYEEIITNPDKYDKPQRYEVIIKELIQKKIRTKSIIKKEFKEKEAQTKISKSEEQEKIQENMEKLIRMEELKEKIGLKDFEKSSKSTQKKTTPQSRTKNPLPKSRKI